MKLGIDWNQMSTKRGAVWVVASIVAVGCLLAGKTDAVAVVMTAAGSVAGGLGLAVKD